MISVCFQGKPFNIMIIQVYALTSNAKEAEVEWFCEDLQEILELTFKKDVLFIIGDWNAKIESQETPGVMGKFGLGVQNEENALIKANTLFQQDKRRLYTKTSVQFSRSVVSDPLRPHESQHARLPCPSPTPGAYSNSCPSGQ